MFRVSLSFAEAGGDPAHHIEALEPVEAKVNGPNVDMLFRGDEASLLERLAAISRDAPIAHFEIRGPSLEEIFVALLEKAR